MGAAAVSETVVWEAQPRQAAFIACPVFEVLFGGARGGGKTDGELGEWISHQDQYGKDASGLMVRRSIRDLEDTIKRSRELYLPLGARFHEQDKVWRFPNKAEIKFRYLDNDRDADHYQGHSYTRVYVEELTQFASPVPIFKLMATLRSGTGVPCGFRATANPGGPGHHWVKERYIDPAPAGWKVFEREFRNPWSGKSIKRDWVFIPSKLNDNKYLGDEYVANLYMSGSAQLVKSWLEGDWSVVEGAFFSEWSSERHVIPPFAIPPHWRRFRSGDWGSAKPFSIGWWAVVGDDYRCGPNADADMEMSRAERIGMVGRLGWYDLERAASNGGLHEARGTAKSGLVLPRGALVRYREWYGASAPNVGLKLPAETVAAGIKEREADEQGDGVPYGVLDPSAFSSDGGPSIAERFAMPPHRVLWRRADNARVSGRGAMGGWDQLRARLIGTANLMSTGGVDWSTGVPMIYFFATCKDAIRTIPALQHDRNRAEDVDTESEDHAGDDTRYACMSRPYIKSAAKTEPLRGANEMTMDEAWNQARPRPAARGL